MQLDPGFVSGSDNPPVMQRQSGCLHNGLFAVAAAWAMATVVLVQGGAWFYDQFALIQGQSSSFWFWLVVALVQAVLLALPIVPLALLVPGPRMRAAYRTWALAIGFGALFSLPRLFPVTWTQPAAVAQIVLALLATFGLSKLRIENVELSSQTIRDCSIFHSQFSI